MQKQALLMLHEEEHEQHMNKKTKQNTCEFTQHVNTQKV